MHRWLDRGYATFSMTDRGFHESCGNAASVAADPTGCAKGYIRLMDDRYEVRDAQDFAGKLADEGLVSPTKIGAIGGSYGGGMSMALAALKDRQMLPDGSLIPWKSPNGTPMSLAAAAPEVPWTDLAYSLTPNGSTLDYVADAPYSGRLGVYKQSFVGGLYLLGCSLDGICAADRAPTRPPTSPAGTTGSTPASPTTATRQVGGHPRRDQAAPLLLLHRPLRAPGAAADLQRLDRRPLPGRRGDPLLQPDQERVPRRAGIAVLRRLRPHARPEQGPRTSRCWRPARRSGSTTTSRATTPAAALAPLPGDRDPDPDLPGQRPSGGPYFAKDWAHISKGEVRYGSAAAKTIAPTAGDPAIGADLRPGRSAAAPARRPPAPTRPARRPTGCPPRRAPATR